MDRKLPTPPTWGYEGPTQQKAEHRVRLYAWLMKKMSRSPLERAHADIVSK